MALDPRPRFGLVPKGPLRPPPDPDPPPRWVKALILMAAIGFAAIWIVTYAVNRGWLDGWF
ncbi:MAG: hypothetical protein KGR26_11145 [Cyanobacteria bacterium REEB65]|nr:hypothetical protein [Cyanobacteria bacterium REEB65]